MFLVIVKSGKELPAAIVGSVLLVSACTLLLSPLRDDVSRHGLPVWLLAVAIASGGLVLWLGVVLNRVRRGR
ncbi:hypothetical protein Cus16_1243 [Curtobacterium sp. ER1/6]|nr:hypothetical protein Cus16_1243 [Curtobacterium sp. ER1/6]